MDRNLGAHRVATSRDDLMAMGDLYQWGRGSDGHQCRTSSTTSIVSSTDQPGHSDFILVVPGGSDWRNPENNNLWQGVNGINNPCPSGFRLPTIQELNTERLSWSSNNRNGAFASPLKLTESTSRDRFSGSVNGSNTAYWSSTTTTISNQTVSLILSFNANGSSLPGGVRATGLAVRCIKD
jgi:uncharacterized protein (TIGR02145 family)